MSIAISLVSLAGSSLLELAEGPGLPIGPKLNKAFMTQAVSVAPRIKKGNYHGRKHFLQQRSVNIQRIFVSVLITDPLEKWVFFISYCATHL